ncbi:SDR family NAD(P)-dependent oxidoreductase [Dongia deserti]|uniref:SDR family NAD(P)-dependent oxidoreductase n=1 Tax=Dongia deserti TaxID=2268030 RepID=UPI000E656522|nr:SDR family oxidoreductase [Dongia deserti]
MNSADQPSFSQARKALFRLDGKVCLVTGGAGHLGAAMSAALAEAGGHVCIIGRTQATLAKLAQQLTGRGLSAEAIASDVTMAQDIKSLVANLKKRHGKLDVLVNNAYTGRPGVMADSKISDYVNAVEIAVGAAAELVNAAHGLLLKAVHTGGDASVINIASMYGMVSPDPRVYGKSGMNNPPHYGAAKAALLQYTRYAAVHLAPEGIRVNSISPGAFPPEAAQQRDPAFAAALTQKVPLGRLGKPEDLAGAVVFLASAAARFVTGANLPVDGGWTAW